MPILHKNNSKLSQEKDDPWAGTNWIREHYNDDVHLPKKTWPAPLTANVNAEAQLEVDLFWSMRSPYSYLVLDRILWFHSNYNVNVNFRPIMPIAIRNPSFFKKSSVPWYRWEYDMVDAHRVAEFHGIPFRRPKPEPVTQDVYPLPEATLGIAKEQPMMWRLTRLSAAAQDQGKGLEFLNQVNRMIWDGSTDNWQDHVVEYMVLAGMDGEATDRDIAKNPDKYDAILDKNQVAHHDTGHGGVPNMAFRGEPFFGEDRFELLSYRLEQNGLTKRKMAIPPIVTKPRNMP